MQVGKGMIASENGDYETAFIEFSSVKEGEFDYPYAQGMIGPFITSVLCPQIMKKRLYTARLLLRLDRKVHSYCFGQMYMLGRGIEKNDAQSAMWFERACESRRSDGSDVLGFRIFGWERC